jgi:uncharacterized protein
MKKRPFNPFTLNTYRGKKWFCDRENDLILLQNHLKNDRNIVLYAWRRMGKSALIHRLFEELEDSQEYETLYIDFLATQNIDEAINAITVGVYEKFGKTKSGITATFQRLFSALGVTIGFNAMTGVPEINLNLRPKGVAEKSLGALGEFLKDRKKRIVVAIDEFQQISNYEEGNAEAVFRGWVQQFPEIRFIFSGSHRKMMVGMFAEKNRPFYQSAQLMPLDPIPLEAYTEFIQKHFTEKGKSINDRQIQRIYEWSRGQTYAIQLLCNHLFAQVNQVKDEDLDAVMNNVLDQQQAIFTNFPKMLTKNQWNLFRAIAKEEPLYNPLSKDFIQKYDLGAASTVNTALKALEKLELVVEDQEAYLVHEVLLARWMARLMI